MRKSVFKKEFSSRPSSFILNSRGFTLLELIISILMIAIIVLIIMGAMRLGARSVDSGEKKIRYFERIRSSFNIIDAQIQSHIPLSYVDNGEMKYYFKGEREFMQFSTNYSIWGGEKGYVVAAYSVKPAENGKQVIYVTENIVGMEDTRETKLFDNFDRIYFEYFFKDPTEEQGRWIEQWTDEVSTPKKIRIHLIEGAKDLSIIIPVRVKGTASGLSERGVPGEEE